MVHWNTDKVVAYIAAVTGLGSILLAIMNILYAYMQMDWIVIVCRVASLIVLVGMAVLVYWFRCKQEYYYVVIDDEES